HRGCCRRRGRWSGVRETTRQLMRHKLAAIATGVVTLVAVLVAVACASKADAPTDTPVVVATTPAGTGPVSTPGPSYIIYQDGNGGLSAREFTSAKTYAHEPVNGA